MAYEQRENSGSLFKNDRKEKDVQPDYRGQALIGGVEVWVSGWVKKAANGTSFMSLSFTPKDQQANAAQRQQTPISGQANTAPKPAAADDFDDDLSIPF